MASLPMHDQSSGPDKESSQTETIQELIFVLRTAQDLVLPLNTSDEWTEESRNAVRTRMGEALPAMAFNATTHLTDPQTRRSHKIRLSVQLGFEKETVKASLFSDSIPAEGTWRASLYEGDVLRASIPFDNSQIELDRTMGPGVYSVELQRASVPVSRFILSLEPFSLPEALEYAPVYLSQRQYIRAQSVLADASARYPENADIQDLQVLALALADTDPDGLHEEESQLGVTRSKGDTQRSAAIPYELLNKLAQETASIVVVQVLSILQERLELQGTRDELVLDAIAAVNKRLDRIEDVYQALNSRIDLVRTDTGKSDDNKFEEIKVALQRFGEELAKRHLRTAEYTQFFTQAIGQNCWNWLSHDVRKIFMESEDHYRHALSRPRKDNPDFTAGLLDLCRGLELLFNERLGAVSIEIARTILNNDQLLINIGRSSQTDTLRKDLKDIIEKSDREKALSMSEISMLLRFGRSAIQALTDHVQDIVGRTPGPADNEMRVLLDLITAEYRNGKMHLHPRSGHKFTKREEMQALRKLVFGIDDGAKKVAVEGILGGIKRTSWLTELETRQAKENLKKQWGRFPGVVRSLWQGFAQPTAASAAR